MNLKYLIMQDIPDFLKYVFFQFIYSTKKVFNRETFIVASILIIILTIVNGTLDKFVFLVILAIVYFCYREFKIGKWKKWKRERYGKVYVDKNKKV